MKFDIEKIKDLFSKKNKKDDFEEIEDEDEFEDDLNNTNTPDSEDDVFDEMEETVDSKKEMDPAKKKKIMIGVAASVVILGGVLILPSAISFLTSSDDEYKNEMIQMQQNLNQQNNNIQSLKSPIDKKEPPKRVIPPKKLPEKREVITKEEPKEEKDDNKSNIKELQKTNSQINKIISNEKIEKSKDLINDDNTDDFLNKINVNANKIKDIVDSDLQNNMKRSSKDLGGEIDPFLLESMVVVDNNYHKKVMMSQVEMMKEFMKYLDIKKSFDLSIKEYKEGKVQLKSIEEKILEQFKKINFNAKIDNLSFEIERLKDENDKLKYLIKQKVTDINDLNSKFKQISTNTSSDNVGMASPEEETQDHKLSSLLDSIDVESLNVYSINNRPIAEIMKDNKYKVYKVGDIFDGFKIKSISMDGLMLSYINSKGIERTKFINTTKDLSVNDSFDVLKIPEAGFNGKTDQELADKTKAVPNQRPTRVAPNNQNQETEEESISKKFLKRLR